MDSSQNKKHCGFTLVELIVVIVILAILATIAFLSFSTQSGSARDSARLSDIASIKKGLEMYNVGSGNYPVPDDGKDITYSGGILWTQGVLGDGAFALISKTLSKKVTDPISGDEYTYSLASNRREYQIAGNMENPVSLSKNRVNPFYTAYFASRTSALSGSGINTFISGNYNGVTLKTFTGSKYYIVASPTIILYDVTLLSDLDYANSIGSGKLLLNGTDNFAKFDSSQIYSSGGLPTDADLPALMDTIQKAYSGSNITSNPIISQILTSSGDILLNLGKGLVKNSLGGNVSAPGIQSQASTTFSLALSSIQVGGTTTISNDCTTAPTGYTSSDISKATISGTTITAVAVGTTNIAPVGGDCTDSSPKILTVTALPNSCAADPSFANLGALTRNPTSQNQAWTYSASNSGPCTYTCINGYSGNNCSIAPIEQWKDLPGTSCDNPDYSFTYNSVTYRWAGCNSVLGTGIEYSADQGCYNYEGLLVSGCNRASTEKENMYYAAYGIDNIWGKLYTWSQASQANNACPTGWHLPSDNEWEILETYLKGGVNCRNATDGWLCTGLGWGSPNRTNATPNNNLVKALKIPLGGSRLTNGTSFSYRGDSAYLWTSSSIDAAYAYHRSVRFVINSSYRSSSDKAYGYSVRCVKN